MASWHADVAELVRGMDEVRATTAHGWPSFSAGAHHFARLRWADDGREVLQTWSGDLSVKAALKDRRDVFPVVRVFLHRATLWSVLERLDRQEVAELLLDSYTIRCGKRRAERVEEAKYFERV